MNAPPMRKKWGWMILFASTTTLLCCALPIILVTLGLGAVSAALFANVPFLTFLAGHKFWLFVGSFLLLSLSAWSIYRPGRTCPVDPKLAAHCAQADRWNKRILTISSIIWLIGFTAAYLSVPLLNFFSR
ncbi:MAG TPA: hypothetical protein ENJ46_02145 [Hellea balneolensis]|uniref:Mercuric transport protein MerT n=1 Tax=Hellea balneolensis TaxID=287478 RepID=A0A7C3GKZ7_9PROT|nr:hypothetical protein [Hellea balneolensis]